MEKIAETDPSRRLFAELIRFDDDCRLFVVDGAFEFLFELTRGVFGVVDLANDRVVAVESGHRSR